MPSLLRTLSKLRGRSADELRVRGSQAIASRLERAALALRDGDGVSDDRDLRRILVSPGAGRTEPPALLESFSRRAGRRFLAGFRRPEATVAALRTLEPEARERLLAAAERVLAGRFDLLGREGLSFGEGDVPDWRLEPLTGLRTGLDHWSRIDHLDPAVVGEYKLTWELNRHQHFFLLGRAYWLTGDERYAACWSRHLRSWIADNPPRRGINWGSSLELAFRSIAWIWSMHFFLRSPQLTPELYALVLRSLDAHGRHVERYLSTYFSPNTHLTGEALGLFYIGVTFPELRRARHWRALGLGILTEQLDVQLHADGVYFEQASYYQRYTIDFYLHLLLLAEANEIELPPTLGTRVQGAVDHLVSITLPDGRTPLIGDDDGGRLAPLGQRELDDFGDTFSLSAVLFARPDHRRAGGDAPEELLWLLGPEALDRYRAMPARSPASTSRAFPAGGYFVMRSGWTRRDDVMVVDCGPHGMLNCGHAHADALGLVLAVRGQPLLVDPGTYCYAFDIERRNHLRGTGAHNAVMVDGHSSSTPAPGPFQWERIGRARQESWVSDARFDFFSGSHDGFAHLADPVTYGRSVLALRGDYWVVRDRIGASAIHDVTAHFHFAPGVEVRIDDDQRRVVALSTAGGTPVECTFRPFGPDVTLRVDAGVVSRGYGRLAPAPVCTVAARPDGNCDLFTLILPHPIGERVETLEVPAEAARAFVITHGSLEDVLLLRTGRSMKFEQLCGDFEWVWLRRLRGSPQPIEIVAVNGRRLRWGGATLCDAASPLQGTYARWQNRSWACRHGDAAPPVHATARARAHTPRRWPVQAGV